MCINMVIRLTASCYLAPDIGTNRAGLPVCNLVRFLQVINSCIAKFPFSDVNHPHMIYLLKY